MANYSLRSNDSLGEGACTFRRHSSVLYCCFVYGLYKIFGIKLHTSSVDSVSSSMGIVKCPQYLNHFCVRFACEPLSPTVVLFSNRLFERVENYLISLVVSVNNYVLDPNASAIFRRRSRNFSLDLSTLKKSRVAPIYRRVLVK